MRGFIFLLIYGWAIVALGGWTQYQKQNRETIEACQTKQVLIVNDKVFQCSEIDVTGIDKARGRG